MTAIVEADLLEQISRGELDKIAKYNLESGQPAPIATAITKGLAMIKLYADPWMIDDALLKDIWVKLAISELYSRLTVVPTKRQKQRDEAIQTLTSIRDGEFKAAVDDTAAENVSGVAGSETKQNFSLR